MKDYTKEDLKELFTTVQDALTELEVTDELLINDLANRILLEHNKEYQNLDSKINWEFIDLNDCILSNEQTVRKYELIEDLSKKRRNLVEFLKN